MATTRQLWQQNNNRLYWEKREQKQRELYMMEEAQQQRELEKIYAEMYRHAEDEINRFYGKYADAEGIDITEAKKRVTQADIEAYEALAKEYVKNKDFSDRANAEMRLYNATMKINRLEMLKARIGVYLVAGINDIDDYYEKVITDRTRQEIERQAGILGETVSTADTVKRAENIVNASFFNATYSERIWSHQDRLRSMINIELQKGLIAGIGSRQMASNIRKEYDVSLADAHRLMVTELRRVQTDVAMDSYKASGVQKYVYMAVNPRACPICREIDGNVYDVADAEPAKNAPPMHPRCHCTTAPYVDEDDYNAWLNYLNQGGKTSDWNNMSPAERQKWLNPVVQSEPKTAETFTPAKDIKEAEEYARSFGLEAHYKGVSIKTANAMNESFKRGIDFCSKVRERLKMVGSGQEGNKLLKEAYTNLYAKSNGAETMRALGYKEADIEKWAKKMAGRSVGRIDGNVYAFARNMDASSRLGADGVRYGGIFVNKSWADYDTMSKSLKGDVASKFHPVGCDTVKAVFDHEMGHQLDYVLDLRNNRKIIDLYRSLSKDDIINGLSKYATVNIKEFIAEGYSEYLNNPNPRDISKQIGEIIEESARTA